MLGFLLVGGTAFGQEMDLGIGPAPVKGQQVAYVAEPQVVAAGRQGELVVRFEVKPGYHVNSHRPKSELLIATQLEVAGAGVKVGAMQFPAGKLFRVGDETLDVYAEDFAVRVPVVASVGSHTLEGTLQYQACDRAACFPPRTLPVSVLFEAK